jgi:hypothetical protein
MIAISPKHRRDAVGGAGSVGHDLLAAVLFVVHVEHELIAVVFGWRTHDDCSKQNDTK